MTVETRTSQTEIYPQGWQRSRQLEDPSATRIPSQFVWAIAIVCIVPFIAQLLGIDFGTPGEAIVLERLPSLEPHQLVDTLHRHLAGSFVHTILEWSAFCAAIFIVLLSFLHYSIKGNAMTPIIGMALFFSGVMDGFHTLAADRLIEAVADNQNLIPFTWAICRLFNALITIIGTSLLLLGTPETRRSHRQGLGFVLVVSAVFGIIAYGIVYICATRDRLPTTMFPDAIISRPWDVAPLVLFAFAGLVVYPQFYKRDPNPFTYAVVVSAIPNIAVQIYMAFGSTALFDSNFNVAHFLKIVAYLVPLVGLGWEYVQTYRAETVASSKLKQSITLLNSLVDRVRHSVALTTRVAASGKQLESVISEQIDSTQKVETTAETMSADARSTMATMVQMQTAVDELAVTADRLSQNLQTAANKANKIDSIIATINEVSAQTKVLALNASIEAARAGDRGRGFAIVAREIRELAGNTRSATEKIEEMLQELRSGMTDGATQMQQFSRDRVRELQPCLEQLDRSVAAQVKGAKQIAAAMRELRRSSTRTGDYFQELDSAIAQLDGAVQTLEHSFYS